MDSLTQAVLGGAVTYAVLGRRLGKRAMLYGAALGTLPDLDVFIDFGGPIENMTYHRGFSHSLFVQAALTPMLAWLFSRTRTFFDPLFLRWCIAIFLCFVTHTLADTFTVYGTQILWPLTDHPFAHSILFIVDPAYTGPLLIAFISVLLIRDVGKAIRLNAWMLGLSTLYLVWSTGAKIAIDHTVESALAQRGIIPEVYESTPAPLNTLLWRGVAVQGDRYYEIWASVFDEIDQVQVTEYPRNLELLASVADHPSVQRLRWFTKGQYKAWQDGELVYLSDLRMGVAGAYVFNFEVGRREGGAMVLGQFDQLEQRPDLDRLPLLWRRIFDANIEISMPPGEL